MRMPWVLPAAMVLAAPLLAAEPEPALHKVDGTGVLGRSVHDADGRDIGRIVDVVIDPSGQPAAIVVDTGGFMGVGARRVAIDWGAMHMPAASPAAGFVTIDLTDNQVRAAPVYNDPTKPPTVVGPPAAAPDQPAADSALPPDLAKDPGKAPAP